MHVCIHSVDESSRAVEGSYSPDENAFFHIARLDSRESKIQIELQYGMTHSNLDSTLHGCRGVHRNGTYCTCMYLHGRGRSTSK
jgi:hypothetical protein